MRNRAWISNWLIEKGASENVISKEVRNGKTYYNINNYERMRELVGELLREVQRITSQGDYAAARQLADGYGKKVDQAIHKEVIERSASLNIPPYNGFVNPILEPVFNDNGQMIDVKVKYATSFAEQMLMYSKNYGFLAPKK
jgi:dipeptidyl-peptidase-3